MGKFNSPTDTLQTVKFILFPSHHCTNTQRYSRSALGPYTMYRSRTHPSWCPNSQGCVRDREANKQGHRIGLSSQYREKIILCGLTSDGFLLHIVIIRNSLCACFHVSVAACVFVWTDRFVCLYAGLEMLTDLTTDWRTVEQKRNYQPNKSITSGQLPRGYMYCLIELPLFRIFGHWCFLFSIHTNSSREFVT